MVSHNYESQPEAAGAVHPYLPPAVMQKPSALSDPAELQESMELQMHRVVSAHLIAVGVLPHLLGYRYLRSAVVHALKEPDYLSNLSKICYPQLAKEFHTNERCVERAMRHALVRANVYESESLWHTGQRSNREFLVMFTEYIRSYLA